jgi:hypothetical protein
VMSLWMVANLGEAEGAKLSILVGRNREALLKGRPSTVDCLVLTSSDQLFLY